MAQAKYEITYVDPYLANYGKTEVLTRAQCNKKFGKDEFDEIVQGYLPHIVAVKI